MHGCTGSERCRRKSDTRELLTEPDPGARYQNIDVSGSGAGRFGEIKCGFWGRFGPRIRYLRYLHLGHLECRYLRFEAFQFLAHVSQSLLCEAVELRDSMPLPARACEGSLRCARSLAGSTPPTSHEIPPL